MDENRLTLEDLKQYALYLKCEERSAATVEKYLREVTKFWSWLDGRVVSKPVVAQWKEALLAQGYHSSTINGKLTALDRLLAFLGWTDCRVKHLKIQRKLFREDCRELTKDEYKGADSGVDSCSTS